MSPGHADPDHAGQLHHLELYAADPDASVDFRDWLLSELGYDRQAPGLNHVAFHAGSREQVDSLTAGVRERPDASLLYEEQHPYAGGYYAPYCEDPAGVKVEVVGPRE